MHHLIFSVASLLNGELQTPEGLKIGELKDVICNKDSGKITYLIIRSSSPGHLFALHHSYFYLGEAENEIVFDQKLGREDHVFHLDLPRQYADKNVLRYNDFLHLVLPNLVTAGHISDNEILF